MTSERTSLLRSPRLRRYFWRALACTLAMSFMTGFPPAFADDDDDHDHDDECLIGVWYYGHRWTFDLNALSSFWRSIIVKLPRSRVQPTNRPVIDEDEVGSPAAHLSQISADDAHEVATGDGIVVAVLDGGFLLGHDDLVGRLSTAGYDAVSRDTNAEDAGNGIDDDRDGVVDNAVGHGTFVAGLVLQAAPDATIMPIRVVNDEGYGTIDALVRGLEHAIDEEVDVINLSLEAGAYADLRVQQLLEDAWDDGIVVVASAGNDGDASVAYLARSEYTISVGAVDDDDDLATFSNGHCSGDLAVYAPGVDIYGPYGEPDDDTMATWSGTSFSAAFVSGAVALYRELHPTVACGVVRDDIEDATDVIAGCSHAGRINLEKVVE